MASKLRGNEKAADAPVGVFGRIANNPVLRLALYYALLVGAMFALLRIFPNLVEAIDVERERYATSEGAFGLTGSAASITTDHVIQGEHVAVIALSMVIAMLGALPVAWVYGWTSRRSTYQKSFAQTLVVFPVAIATVVFLVKGSLALAFSLAGIVAAVRFRNQLSETRDAVFLFVVVGIGLAAGVQLLLVAVTCSGIFNLALLVVSATDFGAKPARLNGMRLRERAPKAGRATDDGDFG